MNSDREDLGVRTRRFALQSIRLSKSIERSEEGSILRRQFLRSSTSIGAQYREARRARSDAEFISKMESASQEIDESLYWLELLDDANLAPKPNITPVYAEANELMAIFTTIVRNRKRQ